jgi:hypothetical protein
MNQSQDSALSYGPDSGSTLDNEFWDGFMNQSQNSALSYRLGMQGHGQDPGFLPPHTSNFLWKLYI